MKVENNSQQASDLAIIRKTLEKGMPGLYNEKQKAQATVDKYDSELQDVDAEIQKSSELLKLMEKEPKKNSALMWATIAVGVAVTAAVGFTCPPAITIPVLGTTFASAHFYKKKEAAEGLLFRHGKGSTIPLKKEIILLQKQSALEKLGKAEKNITDIERKIEESAKMARKAFEMETGENTPGAAEFRVDIEDDTINVNGIRINKRRL